MVSRKIRGFYVVRLYIATLVLPNMVKVKRTCHRDLALASGNGSMRLSSTITPNKPTHDNSPPTSRARLLFHAVRTKPRSYGTTPHSLTIYRNQRDTRNRQQRLAVTRQPIHNGGLAQEPAQLQHFHRRSRVPSGASPRAAARNVSRHAEGFSKCAAHDTPGRSSQ